MKPNAPLCSRSRILFLALCLPLFLACAEIDPAVLETVLGTDSNAPLSESTVAEGLREALRVGSGRAVDSTSRVDGYLANELIRIHLPEELETMARILRSAGFGAQVDALEVAMNRAAEQAAGEAREIFVDAILDLSIVDAFAILRGHETAATDYLRTQTSDELRLRFQPVIANKMKEVDLYQAYSHLAGIYNALPFSKPVPASLDLYLTEEALDGLFTVLAQEERKIREDPLARTTELLRRVFGRQREMQRR